jgi:hypothetical protein
MLGINDVDTHDIAPTSQKKIKELSVPANVDGKQKVDVPQVWRNVKNWFQSNL